MSRTYVMSDLHGCYREYRKALETIDFKDEDTLYILGDVIDRGEGGIRILQDMMLRPNVIPIVGNHEILAAQLLKRLCTEITAENADTAISSEVIKALTDWMFDGGDATLDAFRKLSRDEQQDILDYFDEFSLYEKVQVNGRKYLMVHAGLEPFDAKKSVDDYSLDQLVFSKADYSRPYFDDMYTVTGHTPTLTEEGNDGRVIRRNNHIAIDCGCIYGGRLAVFCLDTEEVFYVELEG